MSVSKNPLYILEAAKNILLQKKKSYSSNEQTENPKLSLVNEEIIGIKEYIYKNKVDRSYSGITPLKENCLTRGVLVEEELHHLHTIGNLLDRLQQLRKDLKEESRFVEDNVEITDCFHKDLFLGNNQYTIHSICQEFACLPEQVDKHFVENKKSFCCAKLEYLMSQYAYSDALLSHIQEINESYHIRYAQVDLLGVNKKINLNFESLATLSEKALQSECPDFELNRMLLSGLMYFQNRIIKEIDSYCNKIELVNHYMASFEKSRSFEIN